MFSKLIELNRLFDTYTNKMNKKGIVNFGCKLIRYNTRRKANKLFKDYMKLNVDYDMLYEFANSLINYNDDINNRISEANNNMIIRITKGVFKYSYTIVIQCDEIYIEIYLSSDNNSIRIEYNDTRHKTSYDYINIIMGDSIMETKIINRIKLTFFVVGEAIINADEKLKYINKELNEDGFSNDSN